MTPNTERQGMEVYKFHGVHYRVGQVAMAHQKFVAFLGSPLGGPQLQLAPPVVLESVT